MRGAPHGLHDLTQSPDLVPLGGAMPKRERRKEQRPNPDASTPGQAWACACRGPSSGTCPHGGRCRCAPPRAPAAAPPHPSRSVLPLAWGCWVSLGALPVAETELLFALLDVRLDLRTELSEWSNRGKVNQVPSRALRQSEDERGRPKARPRGGAPGA